MAKYDSAELAKAIAAEPGEVETAITRYERAMFPRSAEAAAPRHRRSIWQAQ